MSSGEPKQTICFAGFELDAAHRRLVCEGKPIPLNAKAFDLLVFLAKNVGRVVTKDEIFDAVWDGQFVEEANLTVQMSALRKVLGDKIDAPLFLVTIPGKGYEFVADVQKSDEQGEIVIQKQTVTRLVVESESDFSDENSPPIAPIDVVTNEVATHPLQSPAKSLPWPRNNTRYAIFAACALLSALLAVLAYYQWLQPQTPQPATQIKSIAVLPFKPLVSENRNESLEMGMADTLIAKLSNFREINVRPISAVRRYADIEQDAVAAGREQKVDAVLDGQIQKSDEKIRVTVRLVRVEDGTTIWTNQFDEKMTDIFTVQDSISERVAGVLALKLTGEEKEQLTKRHTENTEAYQLYLMGRYHLNRLTDDGIRKSLEYFQQAIDKDPRFALAYVGISDAYTALAGFNVLGSKEVFPKAKSAALKALELDAFLAEAHTSLAVIDFAYDWDWSSSAREFKRALELNPSDSNVHYQYGYYLAFTGDFNAAVSEMKRAQELDPVSPAKIVGTGQVLLLARRYDEAIEHCERALEMDPNLGFAHWLVGLAYMEKGMFEPAIAELQKSIPLSGDSLDEPASLAIAYARSGRIAEARKILAELKQWSNGKYLSPTMIAAMHAALGEKDEAFSRLNQAYDERDTMLVVVRVEPIFDPLRSDPRFPVLLKRAGLSP